MLPTYFQAFTVLRLHHKIPSVLIQLGSCLDCHQHFWLDLIRLVAVVIVFSVVHLVIGTFLADNVLAYHVAQHAC